MKIDTIPEATDYYLTKWRRLLLLRDSRPILPVPGSSTMGVCALCGDDVFYRLAQLQAHHIRPKSLYPALALRLDNGVMLCAGHHQGIVHNHNADLDVTVNNYHAGWRSYLAHFHRWNNLAMNQTFNEAKQDRLPRIQLQGDSGWKRVSFEVDCLGYDEVSGELGDICSICGLDYSEACQCPKPTEDGVEYKLSNGILMGRRTTEESKQ